MRLLSIQEVKSKKQLEQESILLNSIQVVEIMNQQIKRLEELQKQSKKYLSETADYLTQLHEKILILQNAIADLEKKKNN